MPSVSPDDAASAGAPLPDVAPKETTREEATPKKRRRKHRRHHHNEKSPPPKTFMEKLKKSWQDAKDERNEWLEDAREGRRDKWGRKTEQWDKHWREIFANDALERVRRRQERATRRENMKKDEGPAPSAGDEEVAGTEPEQSPVGATGETHPTAERDQASSIEDLGTVHGEEMTDQPNVDHEESQIGSHTAPPGYQSKTPSDNGRPDHNEQEGSPPATGPSIEGRSEAGHQPLSEIWAKAGGAKTPPQESGDEEQDGDSSSDASSTKATVTSKSSAAREAAIRGGSGGDDESSMYRSHEDFDDEYDRDDSDEDVESVSAKSRMPKSSLRTSEGEYEPQATSISHGSESIPHARSPQPYFIPKPCIRDYTRGPQSSSHVPERISRPYHFPSPLSSRYAPAHGSTPTARECSPQIYPRWQNTRNHSGFGAMPNLWARVRYSRYAGQENPTNQQSQFARGGDQAPPVESDDETDSEHEERQRRRQEKRRRKEAEEKNVKEEKERERERQRERERRRAKKKQEEKKNGSTRRDETRKHPRWRRDSSLSSTSQSSSNEESESASQSEPEDRSPLNHLYTLLSVSPKASHAEIVKAGKVARIRVHPDRFGPNRSEAQRQEDQARAGEVGYAADVLGNEERRKEYDEIQQSRRR